MPQWPGTAAALAQVQEVKERLDQEVETNLLLSESIADLELAIEDRDWTRQSMGVRAEFTREGRRRLADLCRTMAVANPLIKRGLLIRIGYIWGQGVQVRARAADDAVQDVNAVVQRFWDDNTETLTSSQAQEELERALGTDGGVYLAAFTSPLTGRVRVRSTPSEEIADIITNPEDRDEPWFYIREYVKDVIEGGYQAGSTRVRAQTVKEAHPSLGWQPAAKIKVIQGAVVRWDAPMVQVPVNRLDGWKFGVPDVYAAVAWATAYKNFLTDWALIAKSLSKFAWRAVGGDKGKAAKAAAAVKANSETAAAATTPGAVAAGVGQAVATYGATLEAIPKSGATIDADSGRPLAAMAAAGIGLPVTMLLADPGVTGARATAETLDMPTILEMTMRRSLWQSKLTDLLMYVIDQAVVAPRGPLRGTVIVDDWGQKVVTLAGDVEKTLEWEWPPLVDLNPIDLIKALVDAEGTGLVPPLVMLRLLLNAMGVKDVDEVIDSVTDEAGRFIDPRETAGQAAADAFDRGDPTDSAA